MAPELGRPRSGHVGAAHLSAGLCLVASLSLAFPGYVAAQQATCRNEFPTQNITRTMEMGGWVIRMTTPNIVCSDGRQIQADQLVTYEDRGLSEFTGNVFFQDGDQTLRSQWAQYQEQVGRLEARGAVVMIDRANGSEVRGQDLRYLREGFGRAQAEIVVTGGRPTARLIPRAPVPPSALQDSTVVLATVPMTTQPSDSTQAADPTQPSDSTQAPPPDSAARAVVPVAGSGAAPTPYDVTADRIEIVGNTYFRASGRVETQRDSMDARSDSLEYDQEAGLLYLDGNASVVQGALDTRGREIMIRMPGDIIRDLVVRGNGRLLNEDVNLESPFIRLELDQGELQGLWAAPLLREDEVSPAQPMRTGRPGAAVDSTDFFRPIVRSESIEMEGDSLDIRAPGQALERVTAIGGARAESSAGDSLNVEGLPDFAFKDWIRGDTVVAVFVRDPEALDANGEPTMVLDRLEARGNASSLYRMAPDSTSTSGQQMAPVPADSTVVINAGEPATGADRSPPSIHYVRGAEIVILMIDGAVDRMEVKGLEQGTHLEPIRAARSSGGVDRDE